MLITIALSVAGYRAALYLVRYVPAGKARDGIVSVLGGGGPGVEE